MLDLGLEFVGLILVLYAVIVHVLRLTLDLKIIQLFSYPVITL